MVGLRRVEVDVMVRGVKARRCGRGSGRGMGWYGRVDLSSGDAVGDGVGGGLEKGRKRDKRCESGGGFGGGGRGLCVGFVDVRMDLG